MGVGKISQAHEKYQALQIEYDAINKEKETAWKEYMKFSNRVNLAWKKSQSAWDEYKALCKKE